jgi:hypothetical protein
VLIESVTHLFFECYVAQAVWECFIDITNLQMGSDFVSVARFWISGKKFICLNVLTSAVLWPI